ncbi:MAG: dienelactone hydrolase family protein [Thiohalospira sp.]
MPVVVVASLFLLAPLQAAEIHTETVTYEHDGHELTGYVAHDGSHSEPRPGVLVVHEWWGHNEYARDRAEQLAEAGYVAFALDMYGGGEVADHPDEAGAFAGRVRENHDRLTGRFDAAHDWLADHELTAGQPLAAVGYCFGGSVALEAARAGADLALVASFHGGLATDHPAEAGEVDAELLVFTGGADPMVPTKQVAGFREEMDAAGVRYTLVEFAGAKHSFTNPEADAIAERFGMPVGYDPRADRDSWHHLLGVMSDRLE